MRFLALLALLSGSLHAKAQTPTSDTQEARARFVAGRSLVETGEFAPAREEFQRGYELSERPAFLFNMAECSRELGRTDDARREYAEYIRRDPDGPFVESAQTQLRVLGPGDETTPDFIRALERQNRIRALEGQAAQAMENENFVAAHAAYEELWSLSQRPGLLYDMALALERAGREQEAQHAYQRALDEAPADPRAELARVRLREARTETRDIPETTPTPAPVREAAPSYAGPWVAASIGAAGLLALAVAGPLALSRRSDAAERCDQSGCSVDELDGVDRAALVADVGLGVGAAGAVTALVWFLVVRKKRAAISPSITPSQAGFSLSGSF